MDMGVPQQDAHITVGTWTADEILHSFELMPVWVHVTGVPHTTRHFLGL
jgi:hypothetical protein